MYSDPNSLIEKINYIKNNDTNEIAKNGYELSTKNTYLERVKMLLDTA
jgi:spore maturation protein CgeB